MIIVLKNSSFFSQKQFSQKPDFQISNCSERNERSMALTLTFLTYCEKSYNNILFPRNLILKIVQERLEQQRFTTFI